VGKTYHDLLLRDDIHAVTIALPIPSQVEYIKAALKAGKHVLSEKPIAPTVKEAEELLEYYRHIDNDKVTWGVAENYRFLESFERAQAEISKLGKVLGFRVKVFMNVKAGGKYFGRSL
jgi:predicted dehydrogenase